MARSRQVTQIQKAVDPYTDGSGGWPIPEMNAGMLYRDVGSYGLRAWSGWVREEFLRALLGREAQRVYREMGDNDATIGAMLFSISAAMRKVDWRDEPADDTPAAQEAADFAHSLRMDLSTPWDEHVVEALSMIQFGFAPCEIVYKKRLGRKGSAYRQDDASSAYDDGKIGIRRLPIRGQETILKWFFSPNGQIEGLTQQPWIGALIDIPIEKLLLFRPLVHKNNPEGRDCTLDTKVRTPSGWTTMGEIQIGDQVYDETGTVRNVTGKTEIFRDRPVYEVEFTTGVVIRTGATHRWSVTDYNDRTHGRAPREMTTEQIAAAFDVKYDARTLKLPTEQKWKHRRARSLCCGAAPVLQSEEVNLPLDPYILGYWLGDGDTKAARISVHSKDLFSLQQELTRVGFSDSHHNGDTILNVPGGLLFGLRAAGVLNDKHVPRAYMLAAPSQRLALLQGLMDSDGYSPGIDSKDEASTFANTNERLITSVVELVRSLGGVPRIRVIEEAGALGGVIRGHQIVARQTSREVRFMLDMPVHRLPRKRHAQVLRRTMRNSGHFIRSVQRVENADTVCIEVDSPSHLFLAGEGMVPTHNSVLRTAYRAWYFKKRIEELEAILFERLGGLPLVRVPNALLEAAKAQDSTAVAALDAYKRLAMNVRADDQMGLVIPSDCWKDANGSPTAHKMYDFELKTPDSSALRVDSDKTIHRYEMDILKTVLADFIDLGHQARGTQNLSTSKMDMFYTAIEGWLKSMSSVHNRYLLPRVWALNAMDPDLLPQYTPDLPMRIDLDVLGKFVLSMAQSGMQMFPDRDLENYIRGAAGMPDAAQAEDYDPTNTTGQDTENLINAAGSTPGTPADVAKHMLGLAALKRRRLLRDVQRPYGIRPTPTPGYEDVDKLTRHELDTAALAARPPTPGQRHVGNYPKGHVSMHGLSITIENAKGSMRTGKDGKGKPWQSILPAHYVRGTGVGADGMAMDVYVGPYPDSEVVFVVDQLDPSTGAFDEHKAMVGFTNLHDALNTYRQAFSDGRGDDRVGAVHRVSMDGFKGWLRGGDQVDPLGAVVSKTKLNGSAALANGHIE